MNATPAIRASTWYAAYLRRLDDDDPAPIELQAVRHLRTRSRLAADKLIVGSWGHLDDLMFRERFERLDATEQDRMWLRVIDATTSAERAAAQGISRSTEYRRRRVRGLTGKPGRPKKR
jgi:hypothetical protein